MEVFQGYGQEPLKVRVLERLAMCQDWNETSGQDCSGYLSHLQIAIRSSLYYAATRVVIFKPLEHC